MVMAISLIITVMTLSVTLSTRERIAVISELKDQSRARMKSYSAVNEVLFNVLTSNFTSTGIKIYLPEAKWKIWNLYGEPIALDDSVTVTLRDGAGMSLRLCSLSIWRLCCPRLPRERLLSILFWTNWETGRMPMT